MRIMISCGEASGDLYAGALAAELRAQAPSADLFGFGGRRLQAAGATLVGDFTGLTVTGLTEAVRVLPRSYIMYRRLIAAARERKPDVFVAIDFPDFNFRLMAKMRRLGVPIVYYVSPSCGPGGLAGCRRCGGSSTGCWSFFRSKHLCTRRRAFPCSMWDTRSWISHGRGRRGPRFLGVRGLAPDAPTVALLPGSRPNEVRRIAPGLAAAAPLIRARVPAVQFLVAGAPNLPPGSFAPLLGEGAVLVHDGVDDVLAASDVVITASGTATVQAALHERPMVVVYRVSSLSYRLGKPFLKVDTYAMPNLVAGRRIVPELIQDDFTPDRLAEEAVALLTDAERRRRTGEALRRVREQLGERGASARAAAAILDVAAKAPRGASPS